MIQVAQKQGSARSPWKTFIVLLTHYYFNTLRAQTIMTLEPKPNKAAVTKLMIDRPFDFRFHAAYLAYSQAWDKTASQETKTKLNEIISSLSNEEIDYSTFYERMGRYRERGSDYNPKTGGWIQTQRKRDWRKRKARDIRNARHKGRR